MTVDTHKVARRRPPNEHEVEAPLLAVAIVSRCWTALADETAPPQYELLPFDYPGPPIRVCRTKYGICLIPFTVVPGAPCECTTAGGEWVSAVSIH